MLTWRLPNETLAPPQALADWQAGTPTAPLELHLWADYGSPGGQSVDALAVWLQGEDPGSGLFVSQGLPPLDELWAQVRVTGFTARGDQSFSTPTTTWQPFGARQPLRLGQLPADCAIHLELRFIAPGHGQPADYSFRLTESFSLHSSPTALPNLGVLTQAGETEASYVITGCQLHPEAPATDTVTLAPGFYLYRGRPLGQVGTSFTLDDLDSAAEPLEAGEHYWAAVNLGEGAPALIKGLRGVDPPKPLLLPYEALAGYLRVEHQPGGGTVVDTADLGRPTYGRYQLTPVGGLTVELSAGEAVWQASHRSWQRPSQLALVDDATSHLWQRLDGTFLASTDPGIPEPGALELWEVTTAGGAVTSYRDLRPLDRALHLRLFGPTPAALGGKLPGLLVEHGELGWEGTVLRLSDTTAQTGGQTQVDIKVNGVTAYTSNATTDLRPAVPFDAANLVDRTAVHELTRLRRGDLVEVEVSELPTGASPAELEVILICRS